MKLIKVENVCEKLELREQYINSLKEPQEFFLEQLISESTTYFLKQQETVIGYCIADDENTLLEFFVFEQHIAEKERIFETVIKELEIESVLCKSFDDVLLNVCMQYFKSYNVAGFLFRNYTENIKNEKVLKSDVNIRICEKSDIADVLNINDDFFIDETEVQHYIDNGNLILFEKEDDLVGCGLYQRVVSNRDYFDIGMLVNPKYRKLGYGTYILNYMKEICIKNNLRPICGCSFKNLASRKCIENIGFINRHLLLDFTNSK